MSSIRKPYNGLPRGVDRDPDQINTMLWKKKQYKKRLEKNDHKRQKKAYLKEKQIIDEKDGLIAPTIEAEQALALDPKKQDFYNKLFAPDPVTNESPLQPAKAKQGMRESNKQILK